MIWEIKIASLGGWIREMRERTLDNVQYLSRIVPLSEVRKKRAGLGRRGNSSALDTPIEDFSREYQQLRGQ